MIHSTSKDIKQLREFIQDEFDMNITQAQDWCADQLYKNRRTWQKWENDERSMDRVYYEYLQIKLILSIGRNIN